MKKIVLVVGFIVLIINQIIAQVSVDFPLEIGNKFYYQAGSTGHNFYYGIVKEITDTLENGFRKVTSKYYYLGKITVKTEYWAYIDGKFYINDSSTVYYNNYLKKDSCISNGLSFTCWNFVPYTVFDVLDTAQQYTAFVWTHSGGATKQITILPNFGIVKTLDESISNRKDSTYLIGIYKNSQVFGDTSFVVPLQDSTYFPLKIGTKWYYQLHLPYDYNNYDEKIIKEVIEILENGFAVIKSTYFYEDSTISKTEYWKLLNGKLYISNFPTTNDPELYYNDELPDEKLCIDSDSTKQCLQWLTNKYVFESNEFDAQIFEFYRFYLIGNDFNQSIVANKLGIVENRYKSNQESAITIEILDSISFKLDSSLPIVYVLDQNYPNPFNPSTRISYQLPNADNVTVKVYDVLGREVATLVNEYRSAGSYEIEFNPSSINHHPSSGVYFYQLKAGDYIQTKKMSLLK